MIIINENNENFNKAKKLLMSQGYNIDYVLKYIINHITNDSDRLRGIQLAYNSDYSTKDTSDEVEDFARGYIDDYIIPAIIEEGSDYEYEYTELFYDILEEDKYEEIQDFNDQFIYLIDMSNNDMQDEIDERNSEYRRSRF